MEDFVQFLQALFALFFGFCFWIGLALCVVGPVREIQSSIQRRRPIPDMEPIQPMVGWVFYNGVGGFFIWIALVCEYIVPAPGMIAAVLLAINVLAGAMVVRVRRTF